MATALKMVQIPYIYCLSNPKNAFEMKKTMRLAFITALAFFIITACGTEDDNKVSIDVSETGPPIEKYIYGQFIEHLGKCIYGGIWAEMVEDRKFYYEITEQFNPYRITSYNVCYTKLLRHNYFFLFIQVNGFEIVQARSLRKNVAHMVFYKYRQTQLFRFFELFHVKIQSTAPG